MKIGGLQKTSLLDYPGCISAIVWTIGCNFRCPFCYNKNLVLGNSEIYSEKEIFSFLNKRKGLLEAVVITGGEPLQELINKKLVDYVAMDVKAPKNKYNQLTGVKTDLEKIEKSIEIIKTYAPDYEFRTTFVPQLLNKDDIIDIAKWLEGVKNYFLQQYKNNPPLISSDFNNVVPYSKKYLIETYNAIKLYFKKCEIRGI